jgi:hypothetical protein
VPLVKRVVRSVSVGAATEAVRRASDAPTAHEAEAILAAALREAVGDAHFLPDAATT